MSLDDLIADVFAQFAAATIDPKSAFRALTLATVAPDGTPDQRTIVLRTFDAPSRCIGVHTDTRATKYAQLQYNPAVALHVWDAGRRQQVRVLGRASLHVGDAAARAAWAALRPLARQLYRVKQSPGVPLLDPSPMQYGEYPEAAAFASFAVINVVFNRIETLNLTATGQIRARFDWSDTGLTASWLVP